MTNRDYLYDCLETGVFDVPYHGLTKKQIEEIKFNTDTENAYDKVDDETIKSIPHDAYDRHFAYLGEPYQLTFIYRDDLDTPKLVLDSRQIFGIMYDLGKMDGTEEFCKQLEGFEEEYFKQGYSIMNITCNPQTYEEISRVVVNDSTILKETNEILPFYYPKQKTAIMFCPIINDSSPIAEVAELPNGKVDTSKEAIQNRIKICKEQGIRIIHFFDDQVRYKPEIVKSITSLALGDIDPENRVDARECKVVELSPREANTFLKENHLYNSRGAEVKLGLKHKDTGELLAVMTFGKSRFNKNFGYELIRYSLKSGYTINGGAHKLHKYFVEKWKPRSIICFADASLFTGALYENLGYENLGLTEPNNWYLKVEEDKTQKEGFKLVRKHRMQFTKARMKKLGLEVDDSKTARENVAELAEELGIASEIWDGGSYKLVWYAD